MNIIKNTKLRQETWKVSKSSQRRKRKKAKKAQDRNQNLSEEKEKKASVSLWTKQEPFWRKKYI